MTNHDRNGGRSRCLLPWILLGVVVIGLCVSLVWGYSRRQQVAEYAVAALLDQQLGDMLPPGEDRAKIAARIAAIMRAVKEGRLDPEALGGFGNLFRQYYADRKLDGAEFESLLVYAEGAISR